MASHTAAAAVAAAPLAGSGSKALGSHHRRGLSRVQLPSRLLRSAPHRSKHLSFARDRCESTRRAVVEDLGVQSSEDDEKVQIEATTSSTSEEVQIEATSSSTSEEVASDDAVGAKERNGRWKDREPGQIIENLPFSVGDVVLGKVVFSNINGSRIEIMCDVPGIFGYMMFNSGPHSIHHASGAAEVGAFRVPRGLVREFQVLNIPDEVRENGMGPLLSAKAVDEDILWRRLNQMKETCEKDRAVYEVVVSGANKGGVRARLQGIQMFIPYSMLPKCPEAPRWNAQIGEEIYNGKPLDVMVIESNREEDKLMGSNKEAVAVKTMKLVYPGALIRGTVRKITSFGVFIGIDNTRTSALLHISNVSQGHLDRMEGFFDQGDRVYAIISELEDNGVSIGRVSISTKELERYPGEMLENKASVFETAEERFAEYCNQSEVPEEY